MSGKASGSSTQPNGDAKHRTHNDGSAGRAYTVEQKAAVLKIRKCGPTAFYEILGLEDVKTTCTDSEIKKAYRKLSLLTHPDKNGYEGADEAFKKVSRAFQILSDPDKKSKYDKFGGDPDSRFGAGGGGGGGPGFGQGASPFGNGFRSPGGGMGRGPMFEEEMTPEELFRQFFGGGMGGMGGPFGGGMFDQGPGFVFNLGGGPGIRVHQFGGGQPRRRPRTAQEQAEPPSAISAIQSLLPLLFLFILPLLSSLFSGGDSSRGPTLRFDMARPPHTEQHISSNLKIPYWVIPSDVSGWSNKQWKKLDNSAEHEYLGMLNTECEREQIQRARLEQSAQGFFFQDEEKMRQARSMDMKSCRRLQDLRRGQNRW